MATHHRGCSQSTRIRQAGRLSEAIDTLKRLLVSQADYVDARIKLSDMYAQAGDEASRVQQLLVVMGDETGPAAQTEFLNEHASSLAAAGQLNEADKLWRLCVTENEKRSDQGLALICASRALRLHMQIEPTRTSERWFSVVQALLAKPAIDFVARLPHSLELAYLKGLRAVQEADVKSALRDLEQLRTVAKQFHGRVGSAHLQRRLEFELALLKQDQDGAVHLIDVMGDQESIDGQPKSCALMMLEARKARRFGQGQQKKERLSAVIGGHCRPHPLLQAYLEVTAYLALAEHMLGQEHKKEARRLLEKAKVRWSRSDRASALNLRIAERLKLSGQE